MIAMIKTLKVIPVVTCVTCGIRYLLIPTHKIVLYLPLNKSIINQCSQDRKIFDTLELLVDLAINSKIIFNNIIMKFYS
jgi:hypothetical protein